MNYTHTDGTQVEAIQLEGPAILNVSTETGLRQVCAEEGDWMITLPQGGVAICAGKDFAEAFTLIPE